MLYSQIKISGSKVSGNKWSFEIKNSSLCEELKYQKLNINSALKWLQF